MYCFWRNPRLSIQVMKTVTSTFVKGMKFNFSKDAINKYFHASSYINYLVFTLWTNCVEQKTKITETGFPVIGVQVNYWTELRIMHELPCSEYKNSSTLNKEYHLMQNH